MNTRYTTLFLAAVVAVLFFTSAGRAQTTGVWSQATITGMTPSYWSTASVVNGKIYLFGGYDPNGLTSDVQSYDPSTDTWTTLQTTGDFTPRYALASCVVNDKIYVLGGCVGQEIQANMSNALEVFDPATNEWTTPQTTGTFTPRNNLTACAVNGKIYALGGYDAATGDLSTLEVFDPATNTWSTPSTTGSMIERGAFHGEVVDGKIYAIGGLETSKLALPVEVFDPATNTWSTLQTKGTFSGRLLHASGVINGKIFLLGGTSNISTPLKSNIVQMFDPSTQTWSAVKMTGQYQPVMYVACATLDNTIHVIGGQDGQLMYAADQIFIPGALNGVEEKQTAAAETSLCPNPTYGPITVHCSSPHTQVDVINTLGEVVMKSNSSGSSQVSLDLSQLPTGAYLVRIQTAEGVTFEHISRL